MLSILIPVYNFDVTNLVKDLYVQGIDSQQPFEIRIYDDGSPDLSVKKKNDGLSIYPEIKYKELGENIGRSKIRNLLADEASFDSLLFLDCDSAVHQSDFISNYLKYVHVEAVVCGGRNYEKKQPADKSKFFRWYYGVKRETLSSKVRKERPYRSFMTNNFMIRKEIFKQMKFNEELIGYGHEDTLFGLQLKQKKVPIVHIDNPLCHIGLETVDEYILKTEEAIRNLSFLMNNGLVTGEVKLLNYYNVTKNLYLSSLIFSLYKMNKQRIIENLHSSNPNLSLFDLYKIGYLISLNRIN